MTQIKKAVIPASGYGTRLLPITKVVSKEMLPLVDRPIIQFVVEELVEAGIEEIIVMVSEGKREIAQYFGEVDLPLAQHLQAGGSSKAAMFKEISALKNLAKFTFVDHRKEPGIYGTGCPVLCAEPYLNGEPFIYTFADDFFVAPQNSYTQMLEAYEKYHTPIMSCQRRTAEGDYDRYGYVGGTELAPDEIQVSTIVEHPGKANKPSDFASLGGFIVTPDVFPYLHELRKNLQPGKELYFHASLSLMMDDGKKVIAKEITNAEYFDTGNKLEYMKTAVTMAARHPEIGDDFQKFLQEFVKTEG